MVKGGGDYLFPLAYTAPAEEHLNVRTNVGMQDLTSMGEVDVKGPGAERLLSRLAVANIYDLQPGQVRYTTLCRADGRIVDDVTVYKFGDEHFMVVTSSAPRKTTFRWIAEHAATMSAYVNDVSGAIALISVQGPQSRDFLASVAADAERLLALKFFRFAANRIDDVELLVSRSGYTGELGYELYVPAEEAAGLWEHLERKGKAFGLLPYGVGAMQSLRIEKALPLAGPDIDGEQTPFEIGLHRWIDFTKRDFIGREALLRIQEQGLHERWVGLEVEGNVARQPQRPDLQRGRRQELPRDDPHRQRGGRGVRCRGSRLSADRPRHLQRTGHTVGKVLALGYVQVTHSWPGARVMVVIGGRPCLATVVNTPFFDPAGNRLRGTAVRTLTESGSAEVEGGQRSAKGRKK
jgi:aminomethyltransferase